MSGTRKSKAQTGKKKKPSPDFHGKPDRSGAPRKNRNSMRHGLKAGQLPEGCKYIEVRLNHFRRQLEDAVMACRGQVSIDDAASIQTALRWERHAALAQRWLTKSYNKLSASEKLHFSREIASASAKRDDAIFNLELEGEPEMVNLQKYIEAKGTKDES